MILDIQSVSIAWIYIYIERERERGGNTIVYF